MTNTQFYFALGVPFFTVVLMYIVATVSHRSSINDLRESMSMLGKRIDDLGLRVNDVRADLGGRLDRIERKLEALDTELRVNHDRRLAVLEARVLEKAS